MVKRGVEVCWDCIKGRHLLCTGRSEPEEPDQDPDEGPPCECPIDHAAVGSAQVQPVWHARGYYVAPDEAGTTGA